MKQVVLIHGGDSFSQHEDFLKHLQTTNIYNPKGEGGNHWNKSLRADLGNDFELYSPSMPNNENAKYEEWKIWFERHVSYWKDDLILVGWSLGGMFLAKYLSEEQFPLKIRGVHLVAAPCGDFSIESESGNNCESFTFNMTTLSEFNEKVKDIHIWQSTDDFVVPFEHSQMYKKALPSAEIHVFEDRNHFLQADFPELVACIKKS